MRQSLLRQKNEDGAVGSRSCVSNAFLQSSERALCKPSFQPSPRNRALPPYLRRKNSQQLVDGTAKAGPSPLRPFEWPKTLRRCSSAATPTASPRRKSVVAAVGSSQHQPPLSLSGKVEPGERGRVSVSNNREVEAVNVVNEDGRTITCTTHVKSFLKDGSQKSSEEFLFENQNLKPPFYINDDFSLNASKITTHQTRLLRPSVLEAETSSRKFAHSDCSEDASKGGRFESSSDYAGRRRGREVPMSPCNSYASLRTELASRKRKMAVLEAENKHSKAVIEAQAHELKRLYCQVQRLITLIAESAETAAAAMTNAKKRSTRTVRSFSDLNSPPLTCQHCGKPDPSYEKKCLSQCPPSLRRSQYPSDNDDTTLICQSTSGSGRSVSSYEDTSAEKGGTLEGRKSFRRSLSEPRIDNQQSPRSPAPSSIEATLPTWPAVVPLLRLQENQIGHGEWLSGSATQGDTYLASSSLPSYKAGDAPGSV